MPFIVGPKMQAGRVLTGSDGTATVTFPEPFGTTPKVFLQGVDSLGRGIAVDLVSVSTTGFSIKARQTAAPPAGGFLTGLSYSTGNFVTGGSDPGHSHSGTTGAPSTRTAVVTSIIRATCPSGHSNCQVTDVVSSNVADSVHTHSFTTGSSYTGIQLTGSPAVTGISASSGSAVTGGSQPISIYVDWMAVEI
jgi:hypothetical protein